MSEKPEKLSGFPFVIGGLSFIPLIGVLFGIAAIIWGLVTRRRGGRKLALVGAGGIAFTVLLYGGLFYFGFVQRGGIYDELRTRMAQTTLNSVVPAIEFYKLQHGSYPDSLEQLRQSLPKDSFVFVYDPTVMPFGSTPRYFFYERAGTDHYYLRGVGADGEPFTADDILPQIDVSAGARLGLLLDRPKRP
jgi:hypothetical protein